MSAETPQRAPDQKQDPEQIKTAVSVAIIKNTKLLLDWNNISDEEVNTVKEDLKKALGIPASEKILMTSFSNRAGTQIEISSAANPLRRYLKTNYRSPDKTFDSIDLDVRSSKASGNSAIDTLILKKLEMPESLRKDITFKRVDEGSESVHEVYHRETNKLLGIARVDEKSARVVLTARRTERINDLTPKSLKDCMAVFAKEGRIRDASMRKTVESAIRKELNLPESFTNRALMMSAKDEGKFVTITIEDKDSEKIIAEIEYLKSDDEFGRATIFKKAIKTIEESKGKDE